MAITGQGMCIRYLDIASTSRHQSLAMLADRPAMSPRADRNRNARLARLALPDPLSSS